MFYGLQKLSVYDCYGFLEITAQNLFVFSLDPEKSKYSYKHRKQRYMYLDSRFIVNRREWLKK